MYLPVKLFKSRLIFLNKVIPKFPKISGIGPVNIFKSNMKMLKQLLIIPFREFEPKSILLSVVRLPKALGIVPRYE